MIYTAVPAYIAETLPPTRHSTLIWKLSIIMGALLSFVAGYWLVDNPDHNSETATHQNTIMGYPNWRWLAGMQVVTPPHFTTAQTLAQALLAQTLDGQPTPRVSPTPRSQRACPIHAFCR